MSGATSDVCYGPTADIRDAVNEKKDRLSSGNGSVDFVRVPISGGKWVTLALHTNALRAPLGHKYQGHLVRLRSVRSRR